MGRSIGTGVATYLSQKRPASSVILVSPYDTLTSVAKGKLPFLPVNLLLKNKFDSISRAPDIKTPLLMLVAAEDTLIPPHLSTRVAKAWGGKVYWEEIAGEDHNSIDDGEIYWNKINEFLSNQISTPVFSSVPVPTSTPDLTIDISKDPVYAICLNKTLKAELLIKKCL
ncbi:MAG: Alpha/beta hydrolase family protein [Firmicutes bacterium ADurb.Bin419]|nr:MAG: Alpha/beta hydrolase family protein [Firmicutes bacterium ADurb.Bin419]